MESQQIFLVTTCSVEGKSASRLTFERLLNETIDHVFSSFGTAIRQNIYRHLEIEYELKKEDIPTHIAEFSKTLEQMFGCAAALVEIRIMKELLRKVPQFKYWPEDTLTFQDYVNALSRFVCT